MNNNNQDIISTTEKVCYNCIYTISAVAIGQGLRCRNYKYIGVPNYIPGLRYSCPGFTMNEDKTRTPYSSYEAGKFKIIRNET